MTPSARTIQHFKKAGFFVQNVEMFIPQINIRRDLFGFIDLVVLDPKSEKIVGIQATTLAHAAERKDKIINSCGKTATAWLKCQGIIEVWGWHKYKIPIERKYWRPKIATVTLDDLPPEGAGDAPQDRKSFFPQGKG